MRISLAGPLCLAVGLVAAAGGLGAAGVAAASKYKACSLLTTAEVEAVLNQKIAGTDERDTTIPGGLMKGEVQSSCAWHTAPGPQVIQVSLTVIRAPRTPQERAEGLAIMNEALETLKKQGWTIQERKFGGMECAAAHAPAGTSGPNVASCIGEKGVLAFSVTIASGLQVSVDQAKSLADKAASRMR